MYNTQKDQCCLIMNNYSFAKLIINQILSIKLSIDSKFNITDNYVIHISRIPLKKVCLRENVVIM